MASTSTLDPEDVVPGTTIRKPKVELNDGNAYAIIGAVQRGLRRAKVPKEIVEKFRKEATSGDYDHLLMVAAKYAEV